MSRIFHLYSLRIIQWGNIRIENSVPFQSAHLQKPSVAL